LTKKSVSSKDTLRKKAESQLRKQKEKTQPVTKADTLRLIHELRVHQIELEMQNEELMRLQAEAESTLKMYAELYAFAPAGYFTLTRDGTIRRANLTAVKLMGVGLSDLIKRRFGVFISPESRAIFSNFLDTVFTSGSKETCEVAIIQKDGYEPLRALIEAIVDSADGQAGLCYAIVSDITDRKPVHQK